MNKRVSFQRILWIAVMFLVVVPGAWGASIERFSPQGDAAGVRQATVRFSDQMVSFGSPELQDPFDISCAAPGKGRWADGKNWVYDFDKDLKAGLKCRFTLKKSVKTLQGKAVTGLKSFVFSTGGPQVKDIYPEEGSERIAEDQILALKLTGEATEESIARNASCFMEDTKERVGVRIVKGPERDALLAALKSEYWLGPERTAEDLYLVQCKRVFPGNAAVTFRWGKGISGPGGVAVARDQVFSFKTRPPFTAKLQCSREKPKADCIGLLPVTLSFSAPVSKKQAEKVTLKGRNKVYASSFEREEQESVSSIQFKGPFPEKAAMVLNVPRTLKDDAGRPLSNAGMFPFTVKTGPFPPLAKFASRFGIIEKADPVLPVTVRSVGALVQGKVLDVGKDVPVSERVTGKVHEAKSDREIIEWLGKVAGVGRSRSLFRGDTSSRSLSLPKPGADRATEVIGIPLDKQGLYVVELKSELLGSALLGARKPMYVPTAALVTNLSAHFKWGRESSLVWVTTLDRAEPVEGAQVAVRDCNGEALWQGVTDKRGIAYVGKKLPPRDTLPECKRQSDEDAYYDSEQARPLASMYSGLFVFARTTDDMTFVHSSWDEGIEPYRFKLPGDEGGPEATAHTIFDRTLFRAGETVHMKHIFRKKTMSGFAIPAHNLPDVVRIELAGQEDKYELPLTFDAKKGTALTSWTIPREAKLGRYTVRLVKKEQPQSGEGEYISGEFRVEEFRVPLMKATLKPLSLPLVNAKEVEMDVLVEYLSGGGATNLPAKLLSRTQPKQVSFNDYDTFTIASGAVKEGIETRKRSQETDMGEGEEAGASPSSDQGTQGKNLPSIDLKLGAGGMARAAIRGISLWAGPRELLTELEFRDPNGEIQTVSRRTPLWPSSVLTGVEAEVTGTEGVIKVKLLALDLNGKPLPGTAVKADLLRETHYSHRTRLVGGFYSYQGVKEVKRIGPACEGVADKEGVVRCEVKSPVSGSVIVEAKAVDSAGNPSVTHDTVWVPGKDEWWFDQGASDRIDVIPEKKRYEPGETASFQVRMPMREATVLVTVEREGVLEAEVKRLTGKNPVITLPVKGSYAPNVFVSALCLRGRVTDKKPTALVDLGRPSYKLGITGISVGWAAHELKVTVSPEKKVYRVRDKAMVKIKVVTVSGKPLPHGAEVAVAAVDEGLLELMPNRSWSLLEKMMQKRGYGVRTATAQMQVVGKRHFGLKAVPGGGGGGRQTTRELFDTLLFWNGAVPLDEFGEASVVIPLSDSLTGFTIAAVATAGKDLFGTGQAGIQTTQDLMLTSGLPALVRAGDRFRAGFLVRNTTHASLAVEIDAAFDTGKRKTALTALTEEIAPGEAKEIGWDVTVPTDAGSLTWDVRATAKGGSERDALKVTQKVAPYAPVRIMQATLAQLDGKLSLGVEAPKGAVAGKGGVRVTLRPKLSGSVSGITEYMSAYPFTCLEQQVSRTIALEDKAMWAAVMARIPSYLDNDGLLRYFPQQTSGSEVLTAYVLSVAAEAGWEIPDGRATRMEEGLTAFVQGKLSRPQPLPTADLTIRKLAALAALAARGKAEPKLLGSITIDPNLWPTSAVLDWIQILTKVKTVPDREKKLRAAEESLRSRLNFQGTVMGFSTEKTDNLWWLMTGGDVNSVRTVLTLLGNPSWREDVPRIMKGAMGRQQRGRWDTTVANAWGRLALRKFGAAFEAASVSGTTAVGLSGDKKTFKWDDHQAGGAISFGWPKGAGALSLTHEGTGKPWVTVESLAAVLRTKAFSGGYIIRKSMTPVTRKEGGGWSVGDVVRVKIEGEARSDMTWVALSDPIPAGAAILGSGLGRDSAILTSGEKQKGWVRPVHEERSFEAFRAYYEYVPKGKWTIEYTMRLNNPGAFLVPPTRIEALYAPEMFGELPNGTFEIK